MLRGRERAGLGGVHYEDALGGRRFEIDVDHTDSCAGDCFELSGVLKRLGDGGLLWGRADDHRIVISDDRGQLFIGDSSLYIKRRAFLLEVLQPLFCKLVGDQNLRGHRNISLLNERVNVWATKGMSK